MESDITQDAILRNKKLPPHGMESNCATRNYTPSPDGNPMMPKRNAMIAARKRAGLSQEVIAERMGVSSAQISRWETGKDGIPSQRFGPLSRAYEAPIFELLAEDGEETSNPVRPNATIVAFEGASSERMRQDVPILGTALGADRVVDDFAIEQSYLYSDEIIGHAKRPVVLDGRADVYGIYVQGASMDPAFEDGALVFVEPNRPPRIGDNVVLYLRRRGDEQEADDGESARMVMVKRLVRRSSSFYELEQHNPKAQFRIDAKDVLKVHRVIPYTELLS